MPPTTQEWKWIMWLNAHPGKLSYFWSRWCLNTVAFLSLTRSSLLLGAFEALPADVTSSFLIVTWHSVGQKGNFILDFSTSRGPVVLFIFLFSHKKVNLLLITGLFQALLDVLQQEQPELAETAATMTQQQRENWLQQLRNKMNALDPGMVFVINKKPTRQ